MSKELTFKVSAKTARLIGRENVSTADGAISELVKNSYDADAKVSIVAFVCRYKTLPDSLPAEEHRWLMQRYPQLATCFETTNGINVVRTDVPEADRKLLEAAVLRIRELIILDNGNGMSEQAIAENWMVIGTNFKEKNELSEGGRTRTGAKGIGRFALDRLGEKSVVASRTRSPSGSFAGLTWSVDWGAFEHEGAVLEDVKAVLDEDTDDFRADVERLLAIEPIAEALKPREVAANPADPLVWNTGTCIRISLLRDEWDDGAIGTLRHNLGLLVPPDEQASFRIVMFNEASPSEDVEVASEVLQDFDYKVEAAVGSDGNVAISIWRNELDIGGMSDALFERNDMKAFPFDRASFDKLPIKYTRTLTELLGTRNRKLLDAASRIGPFSVKLRFYKFTIGSKDDQRKYPYRSFQPGPRKEWLDRFAGIKIYRDNFFVRPYGEAGGRAFDWLGLGGRRAANPVQPSRKGWPVSPKNITGTISISRKANAALGDQSNRESIIENDEFIAFREIVLQIIAEFERDRSTILSNLLGLYNDETASEGVRLEGERIAEEIVQAAESQGGAGTSGHAAPPPSRPAAKTEYERLTLSRTVKVQQQEIREKHEELMVLQSLATLGTVLVSFTHEMGNLQNAMGSRSSGLAEILEPFLPRERAAQEKPAFNPYVMLDEWAEEDRKVKQWFSFVLNSVRPERRRRKHISLRDHLNDLPSAWQGFLEPRHVQLHVNYSGAPDATILAFEIELDSIFHNLILNSVEAFMDDERLQTSRVITLDTSVRDGRDFVIVYGDNGPGLDRSILRPSDIFEFGNTTKRDAAGKAVGTGLGMWILSSIVRKYGGSAEVKNSNGGGFRIEIRLPVSRVETNDGTTLH
ncbi:sensor histidine kinase [Ensifer adhaerens]|uniref:sensor histidine kinase n=1 Tax=Ensifer adhaerens TaxID=106592 RepID=UPI00132F3F84|nr:sensor histidine kinase [Ensifer adhaerens]QHG74438.1 sensor histidine kinase [Ensifer adhaerens]